MYKVRDKKLKNLYYEVMDYKKIIDFNVLHIDREKNKEADKLAKNASKMNKNKTYYEN
jgi:hypothetical protein